VDYFVACRQGFQPLFTMVTDACCISSSMKLLAE
jgi:hypothetical protein